MAIYLKRNALQSRLKALLSTRNLSFVRSRNWNPDMLPKAPTLKDLTSRIAEKCESLAKNEAEKDDKEPNTELGFYSISRNCQPKAPTLKDLTSRIAEKCESLAKIEVEKDDKETNTELGSHSMSVANEVEKDSKELNAELGSHSMSVAGKVDVSKWRKLDSRRLGIHRSQVSPPSLAVLKILKGEGFDTYLVGGCVRDLLLNKVPKDFDIITTASLQQIKRLFHRCLIVGKRFPICLVSIRGTPIEVSSFETASKNSNRKEKLVPSQESFGCDKKDLALWRNSLYRDFTINSLYYDPFVGKVYDYADGMMDLKSLKLRTIGSAQLSFEEDCARILRGLRIAARLGLSFSNETDTAIRKLSSSVTSLAKARLMMEMNYMLSYGAAKPSLSLLRRFNLLEILLPFQAAYLNEHARKRSCQSPAMLMELFFNLDRSVTCDQPSDCSLWVGLLAFHTALVHKPQDALVVWTFASVLYHRTWEEAVQFAREHAQAATSFSPEIPEARDVLSDKELANRVTEFAYFVQYCIGSLVDKDALFQSMCRFPDYQGSDFVFLSQNAAHNTSHLFSMLVDDVQANIHRRKSFKINYELLKKGDYDETSFVLGKIITDTLKSGVYQASKVAERRRVLPATVEPINNQLIGEIVNLIGNDRIEKRAVEDGDIAKPDEVAQNQQNKDEKVSKETIVTRVSKWWKKLVQPENETEDQKACQKDEGKEIFNFPKDGSIPKQETVVNEEPEKVTKQPQDISENGCQEVAKKQKKENRCTNADVSASKPKKKARQVKPHVVTEETQGTNELKVKKKKKERGSTIPDVAAPMSKEAPHNETEETQGLIELNNFQDFSTEMVDNALQSSILENEQDKTKNRGKKKKRDFTENECGEVTKKRQKVKKESSCTKVEEAVPKSKKKKAKPGNVKEEKQGLSELNNFQDSSPEVVVNKVLPSSILESDQDGMKKKPKRDITENDGQEVAKKCWKRQKVKKKESGEFADLDVSNDALSSSVPERKQEEEGSQDVSDAKVISSESNEIPKQKKVSKGKKLLRETIEYQTQKLIRRGRTSSEILAIMEQRGKTPSEVLAVMKQKPPVSFEPSKGLGSCERKGSNQDLENSKKDESDKKRSGTVLSSLFR